MKAGLITSVSEAVPGGIWALLACSIGTIMAGLTGCTPIIIAVECTAGILGNSILLAARPLAPSPLLAPALLHPRHCFHQPWCTLVTAHSGDTDGNGWGRHGDRCVGPR